MSCENPSFPVPSFPHNQNPCTNTIIPCSTDASTIMYTGASLQCSGAGTNKSVQEILQLIDEQLCISTGINWSSFNYYCLSDDYTITSAQTFAEAISQSYCTLKTDFNSYVTSNNSAITTINSSISSINSPNFSSCAFVNIGTSDSLNTVLQKLSTASCTLNTAINPSGANWNQCVTVSPLPTTITAAFNVVIGQLCTLRSSIASLNTTLPTFNNAESCLSIQGATDTLYNTVVAIRDKVCGISQYDWNEIVPQSCVNPIIDTGGPIPTLNDVLNTLLAREGLSYPSRVEQWDSTYFVTSLQNPSDACSGLVVSLNPSIITPGSDKYVRINSSDSSSGYLANKLTAGSNITLDVSTTPGTMIVSAGDDKVKANSTDTSSDYLINKIDAIPDVNNVLSLVKSYNSTDQTVEFQPQFDFGNLTTQIFNYISANPDALAALCALTCQCDCDSTTTTTTTSGTGHRLTGIIRNNSEGSNDIPATITFSQLNPTLSFYNSNMIVVTGATVTTGAYTITSTDLVLNGRVQITSHDSASFNYNIYVKDSMGVTIPSSGTSSGTINPGNSIDLNPFAYGTGTNYFLYIDLVRS